MSAISGKTRLVGVWGYPVSHSRSPAMHNAALKTLGLDWAYLPFEVNPAFLPEAVAGLAALGILGVNVTVPLKEAVLPFAALSEEARQIGSVNTLHLRGGVLHGDSTDGRGFLRALAESGQSVSGRQAYILGAGGSARAVAFALAGQGNSCRIANRTASRASALAADINRVYPGRAAAAGWGLDTEPFDLLVNTTSLGMSPDNSARPALPPGAFEARPFVYDLIYSPAQTRLLAEAESAGCETRNGVTMLVQQGALSLALWTGLPVEEIPVGVMEQAVRLSL